MKGTPNDKARLSLALDREWKKRAGLCAEKTKLSMHTIAQAAVEAAVQAIENANYRIVMPIEFAVTYIPITAGKRLLRETNTR